MAPLSVGTQTAGSILRPSAFCGAVGFKPTLDAIPYVGIRRYSRPLDVIGPIARSVADAALFMRAFTGDPVTTRNRRCATISASAWRSKHWADTEPGMREAFDGHLSLSRAGVQVTELSMPSGFEAMGEAQDVIMAYDLAREYAMLKRDHAALCDPGLIEYLTMGEGISASEYAAALDAADACRRAFHDVARDVDALACHPRWARRRLPAAPAVLLSSASGPCCTTVDHLAGGTGTQRPAVGLSAGGFRQEDPRCYWARCVERILGPPRTGPEPDSCLPGAHAGARGISGGAFLAWLATALLMFFSYLLGFSL